MGNHRQTEKCVTVYDSVLRDICYTDSKGTTQNSDVEWKVNTDRKRGRNRNGRDIRDKKKITNYNHQKETKRRKITIAIWSEKTSETGGIYEKE
jgi:hypothetical protein